VSVRTTADEKLEQAKHHVLEAIKALQEIVVGECDGHDDYRQDYEESIHWAHQQLLEIRKRLRP